MAGRGVKRGWEEGYKELVGLREEVFRSHASKVPRSTGGVW